MGLLKTFSQDMLRICIYETRAECGAAAGRAIAACMRELLAEKAEISVIFAAAPSQDETLETLIAEKDIDWGRVNAYHMDEYIGLPADAPQGFGNYLCRHLFDRVAFKSVHLIGTDGDEKAAAHYAAELRRRPIDIVVLGIGENGHIAFNDPWEADFADVKTVKRVKLDETCRLQQVHDGCFSSLEDVPQFALTLTIPTLFSAAHLFCTVPSATKAQAVYQTVHHKIDAAVPSTVMRLHEHATLYCDRESGEKLL